MPGGVVGSVTHQFVSTVPDDSDPDTVSGSDWNQDHAISLTASDVGAEDAGAVAAHTGDASDAHDASAISVDSTTLVGTGTDVQAVLEELDDAIAAAGAPANADYLVGTSNATLSGEIVVGTSPGGELGGSWASPTVDATHSGSAHHDAATEGIGIDISGQVISVDLSELSAGGELGGTLDAPTVDATHSGSTHAATQAAAEATAASALSTHAGAADPHTGYLKESDFTGVDFLVGTATGITASEIAVGTTPGGELGGTWASPTVDATHSGSAHVALTANTPSTQALGDSAAVGSGTASAKDDHKHAMPAAAVTSSGLTQATARILGRTSASTGAIEEITVGTGLTLSAGSLTGTGASGGTPAPVFSTTNAAGSASTFLRTDDQLAVFDATAPTTQAFSDAAAAGSAGVAARRDHKHAWPALGTTAAAIGTSAGGSATTPSKSDHVHATGAGTPSTQAFGDAAATGTGPAAAMTDHKHAMMADPTTAHVAGALHANATMTFFLNARLDSITDGTTNAAVGSAPDATLVSTQTDGSTQGNAFAPFAIPANAVASQPLSIAPVWAPVSTDASAHAIQWSADALILAAGVAIDAAGTTTAWTGAAAARTAKQPVLNETVTQILASVSAGDIIRLNVRRVGGDAADTYVGNSSMIGVRVSYTGTP